MERTNQKMRDNVRTSDRKRLDFLLRRTRVVVLGKETASRFIGNEAREGGREGSGGGEENGG